MPCMRLVTGGNDKVVKVWTFDQDSFTKPTSEIVGSHNDWVRDVAWCNGLNSLKQELVASCSNDGICQVWTNDGGKKEASDEQQSSSWSSS